MKTLLSGCSLSDYCGWNEIGNHNDERCWYNIVANRYNLDLTNLSYGGHSNREILHKIATNILLDDYELVIVQLTSTNRHWFYRYDNPEEFCILNGANIENAKSKSEQDAFNVFRFEFNNVYTELERDLVSLLMIQRYLESRSIPLVLVDMMGAGATMNSFRLNPAKHSKHCSPEYLKKLSALSSKLNLNNSVGFNGGILMLQNDFADDLAHPGVKTNIKFAELIGDIINKLK